MENIYFLMIVALIVLAVADLVVGVSNDAVNFLVSAIGSKVAPFRVIMIIASLGVLFGATFSSGMMDVARKEIFHPDMFSFNDIMIIFLAVMFTDIILLDLFNTFGMPTSTTVSIVFELLGSAIAMSVIIILKDKNLSYADLDNYINTGKALLIIAGILLSVFVAFSVGAIVQFFSRLLFSFNYRKSYKYFGAIWGSIAITAITYFILIKGLKGSSFAGKGTDIYQFATEQAFLIIVYSFLIWSILLAFIQFLFKVNIFKIIVLIGTFALAMAFAGNDLVNFIGVPIAGFESYQAWASSAPAPGELPIQPELFRMTALSEAVSTPTLFLLIAGLIMVVTLWLSKKSKSVTETSLELSRQDEGRERFESSGVSRAVVRMAIQSYKAYEKVFPKIVKSAISKRFQTTDLQINKEEQKAFDLVRASVNLMVAGILIAIGTSFKLPLSTTYVTFMVAMGTSLADKAWGRESAVYRVSGVMTVVAGWFFTAFIAFTVAFIFAFILFYGKAYALFIILGFAVYSLFNSRKIHKKRETKKQTLQTEDSSENKTFLKYSTKITDVLSEVSDIYISGINAFKKEKRKKLKNTYSKQKEISNTSKELKNNILLTIEKLEYSAIDTAPYYVQVLDYIRETTHALHFIIKPMLDHLNNNHNTFSEEQFTELENLSSQLSRLISLVSNTIENKTCDKNHDKIVIFQTQFLESITDFNKQQIKRIKNKNDKTRNSMLYLNILAESKNIALYIVNLFKSHRDFLSSPQN